jgi:hypothetical protein
MALTLLEAAKTAPPETAVYIEEYADSSDVLAVIPFENIDGNAKSYNREQSLPGVGFRGVNEGFNESTGVLNPQTEVLKISGGDLDVDKFLVDTQGDSVRSTHELLALKSHALAWTRNFIKGDSVANPRVFDGLQVRLTGSQLIDNGAASGAALSLNKLDELIDQVTNPTHLIMSKAMRRQISAASRNTIVSGCIQWEKNEFGKQIALYADLPILTVWQDNNDMEILPFDESSPDGSATNCASIYCVSFGDMMLTGLQGRSADGYGISSRDLGEIDSKPVYRTRIDWNTAIACYHGRAAARLRGITKGAITF